MSDTLFEYNATGNFSNDFKAAKWYAMQFTPQTAHLITSCKFQVYRVGNGGGTWTVGVRAVDGSNKPTGADLCSGSMAASSVTTSSPGILYELTLGAGYELAAETMYAFVLRTSGGDSSNFLQLRYYAAGGVYNRGSMLTSTDSGSTWTQNAYDAVFYEYGLAAGGGGGHGGPASLLIAQGVL